MEQVSSGLRIHIRCLILGSSGLRAQVETAQNLKILLSTFGTCLREPKLVGLVALIWDQPELAVFSQI